MAEIRVLSAAELPAGKMKVVKAGEIEVLLIHHDDGFAAVQPKCPHAGAPLEEGAICKGRLVCPWHLGTFALPSGEIVEPPPTEPLQRYAVRLVGQDLWVDPVPLPRQTVKQTAESPVVLLVGAGAAGMTAAMTLRENGFDGKIVAVDPVADEPVDRTQLSKDGLGGQLPLDDVVLPAFDDKDVERVTASVTTFSAAKREVRLSDGRTIQFDQALVATGGTPKRLEIPGADSAYTIRHTSEVRRIKEAAEGKQRVVIVGTSFIALEAASALVQKGLQVTVTGRETLPFARQFGDQVALALKKLHESQGTKFRLGVEIVRIEKGQVTVRKGVVEEQLSADLVILGVGVAPELHFEHDLPVAPKGGGIQTDESLRAADAVWVAGDIANVKGTRIEHWRVAQQHGRIAALAMLGRNAKYEGVPFFWTYHFSKTFGYLGHAEEWDETFVKGDIEGLDFLVFYVKAGRVKAVLNCGRDTQMAALAEPMREGLTLAEAVRVSG